MSDAAAKVLEQALALSVPDQRAIRQGLRQKRQAELDETETELVRQRSDLLHSGTAELLDGEQVEAELLERLRRRGSL